MRIGENDRRAAAGRNSRNTDSNTDSSNGSSSNEDSWVADARRAIQNYYNGTARPLVAFHPIRSDSRVPDSSSLAESSAGAGVLSLANGNSSYTREQELLQRLVQQQHHHRMSRQIRPPTPPRPHIADPEENEAMDEAPGDGEVRDALGRYAENQRQRFLLRQLYRQQIEQQHRDAVANMPQPPVHLLNENEGERQEENAGQQSPARSLWRRAGSDTARSNRSLRQVPSLPPPPPPPLPRRGDTSNREYAPIVRTPVTGAPPNMPTLTASPLLDAGQSMSPQFPSNDVDSYWYHQSSTTQQSEAEDAEDAGNNNVGGSSDDDENSSGRHSAGALPHQYADRHLVTRTRIGQVRDGVHAPLQPNIQAAPLLNAGSVRAEGNTQSAVVVVAPATQPARREGAFPSIPRNASIEESRLTMLAVLRAHRTFASGHNSDDSDFEAYRAPDVREVGSSRRPVAMSAISMTNPLAVPGSPPPYDSRTDKPEAPENDGELGASGRGSQGSGRAQAESDRRLVKWLMKNTVDVRPLDCALLRPGMKFSGVQELTRQSLEFHYTSLYPPLASINSERWDVEVVIQSVDMKHGKLAGLMKAINVPRTHKLITTSWKGEVVDFVNYTPRTNKWNARCTDDTRHWSLFPAIREHPEAFLHKWPESLYGKRMPQVLEDYLFMRWKETEFVDLRASETGLTIDGFYYICMNRRTGSIEGVYFDPSMRPYQRLTLETKNGGKAMSFAASALC